MTPGCSRIFAVRLLSAVNASLRIGIPHPGGGGAQQEKTWLPRTSSGGIAIDKVKCWNIQILKSFVPVALDGEPRDQDQQYTAEEELAVLVHGHTRPEDVTR